MATSSHTGAFIFGAVLGAVAGAAVTLWLTPRSGQEWRDEIFGRGRALQERVTSAGIEVQTRSRDLLDQGRQKIGMSTTPDGEDHVVGYSVPTAASEEPRVSVPPPGTDVPPEPPVTPSEETEVLAEPIRQPAPGEAPPPDVSPSEETAAMAEIPTGATVAGEATKDAAARKPESG